MGMAEDTDVRLFRLQNGSPVFRHLSAFVQNMTDGDAEARQFDYGLGREPALFIIIDVARDGGDWCDLLQLFDHGPIANVPGVENMIDAFGNVAGPQDRIGRGCRQSLRSEWRSAGSWGGDRLRSE